MALTTEQRAQLGSRVANHVIEHLHDLDPQSRIERPPILKAQLRQLLNAIDGWLDSNAQAEADWVTLIRWVRRSGALGLIAQRAVDARDAWSTAYGASLAPVVNAVVPTVASATYRDFLQTCLSAVVEARHGSQIR